MPIRAENRARYPKDWPEISSRKRESSGWKCEWCAAPNGAWGYRDDDGKFHETPRDGFGRDYGRPPFEFGTLKIIAIVLTVAHLDHQPENCDPANLAALCQRCHNRYDAKTRAAGVKSRRHDALNVPDLFPTTSAPAKEGE
jgi:hypothetical protein